MTEYTERREMTSISQDEASEGLVPLGALEMSGRAALVTADNLRTQGITSSHGDGRLTPLDPESSKAA